MLVGAVEYSRIGELSDVVSQLDVDDSLRLYLAKLAVRGVAVVEYLDLGGTVKGASNLEAPTGLIDLLRAAIERLYVGFQLFRLREGLKEGDDCYLGRFQEQQ